jgi:hypothetical protein
MPVHYDTGAEEFTISPGHCGDCGDSFYDTGCDAPGCNGQWCVNCGTGCDIEADPDDGRCASALDEESDEAYMARIDAERAAFGLSPIFGAETRPEVPGGQYVEGGKGK